MKIKFSVLIALILFSVCNVYSQDSLRTRNDKPGTPQSLRSTVTAPESHVTTNNNPVLNQNNIDKPSESNNVNNTTQQTITTDNNNLPIQSITKPNTLNTVPPATMKTTTNSSAIQNGISNASKPLRH